MVSQQINNSFIINVGYSCEHHELTIKFKKGTRFRYYHVPYAYFNAICISNKPGAYYRKEIKGKFSALKLKPNQA
jgi:hypothetical protein